MSRARSNSEVLVVGGRQRRSPSRAEAADWQYYDRALILAVDCASGAVRECVSYESPEEVRAEGEPSILFKTATLHDGRLYACTPTEVLIYDVPAFRLSRYLSLPCMNDVHHAQPLANGNLLVVNTGLDMVIEVAPDDTIVREWSAADEELWSRFSRETDYRLVASTKPHKTHPNFVFELAGELWATRCLQAEAVCLTRPGRMPVGSKPIHDGRVSGESVWFTQVDGRLIEVDARSHRVRRDIDLQALVAEDIALGWCRGLEVIGPSLMLLGFTRLRSSRWRHAIDWVKYAVGGAGYGLMPTRLAAVDLDQERIIWERDLEEFGMSAIFSIHALAPDGVRAALTGEADEAEGRLRSTRGGRMSVPAGDMALRWFA